MRRTARSGNLWLVLTKFVGSLAMVIGLVALGSQPASASPLTLFVNGIVGSDSGDCSSSLAPCATISYALTQAAVGATIYVANGTYPEQLTITQSVSIIGASAANTIIRPTALPLSDSDTDSATPQDYIVDVAPNTAGVNIKHLTIDGSGASSTFTSCSDNYVGVYFHDASGHLGGVRVTGIALPTGLSSCEDGLGVYAASDSGSTSSVNLGFMRVSAYQRNGITCDDAGTTCSISMSRITGSGPTNLVTQTGIQIFGASAVINKNRVRDNSFTGGGAGNEAAGLRLLNAGTLTVKNNLSKANDIGIYAGEVPADGLVPPTTGTWTISNNRTTAATDAVPGGASGYGDGIAIDSTSNTVNVTGNRTRGDAEYGIALYGATGSLVRSNIAKLDYDGLYVGGPGTAVATSSGNTVTLNVAQVNHRHGILADLGTTESGNTFTANASRFNVSVLDVDLSSGGGTAGTANTWTTNRCRGGTPSSPSGLC